MEFADAFWVVQLDVTVDYVQENPKHVIYAKTYPSVTFYTQSNFTLLCSSLYGFVPVVLDPGWTLIDALWLM